MIRDNPRLVGAFVLWLAVIVYVLGPPVAAGVSDAVTHQPEPLGETEYMAVECAMVCSYAEVKITEEKANIREHLCSDSDWHTSSEVATRSNIVSGDAGRIMLDMPVETKYDPWPPKQGGTLYKMNQSACSGEST